eukprot:41966-Prymnesium_polylepis.1
MRKDVQEIFKATPHEKQVMMFSATLSQDMRAVCKKFMQVRPSRIWHASPEYGTLLPNMARRLQEVHAVARARTRAPMLAPHRGVPPSPPLALTLAPARRAA